MAEVQTWFDKFVATLPFSREKPYTGTNERIAHEKTIALLEDEGHLDSTEAQKAKAEQEIAMIANLQNDKVALNEYLKSIGR